MNDLKRFDMNHLELGLPEESLQSRTPWYLLFCIDSYLPQEFDEELTRTFPNELMLKRLGLRLAANVDLLGATTDVREFLHSNPAWDTYVRGWASDEQLRALAARFSKEWSSRWCGFWRPLMRLRSRNTKNLEVTVLLSAYRRGFQLSPHSDDKFKLLSLIHYLPDSSCINVAGAGTTFFSPKPETRRADLRQFSEWSRGLRRYLPLWLAPSIEAGLARRYFDSDVLSNKEQESFLDYFTVGEHIEYRRNRISGFVKNDWSMHEVNLMDFPADELRRAVLVNVRLRPTWVSKLIPGIEHLYIRIRRFLQQDSDSRRD